VNLYKLQSMAEIKKIINKRNMIKRYKVYQLQYHRLIFKITRSAEFKIANFVQNLTLNLIPNFITVDAARNIK